MLCKCIWYNRTINELMAATHVNFQTTRVSKTLLAHSTFIRFLVRVRTHVVFQTTRFTKTLLAHIAFIRLLVRVNTHVGFQMSSLTKSFIAHITFIRFLFRVNTHVDFQIIGITKTLLANLALALPSLSLRSFLKSRFFFLYLMMIRLEIILLIRNPRTQHQRFFFLTYLQNRLYVHRSFRMWILSPRRSYSLLLFVLLLLIVVVVVVVVVVLEKKN